MEERLFRHLLRNEPKAVELTKKEYENYRSDQGRPSGQNDEDDTKTMGADS